MKCECVAISRKKRIVARVKCRNIKNECPEVNCDNPVQKPGQCCKMCPEDFKNGTLQQEPSLEIVPQNPNDEEEKSSRHFSALLTHRSSLVTNNEPLSLEVNNIKNIVATGRFSFIKKNLHFSFYISEKAARPRLLQFVDASGNILEEFSLSRPGGSVNSVYQNATRKVCGVWKRVPRDYKRDIRHGKMWAVLVWGEKESLSGQILNFVALEHEIYSSLLEPAPGSNRNLMLGSGGTAIIKFSTTTSPSSSIHLSVIFNGLFALNETSNVPIKVTLSHEDKDPILEEVLFVKKPSTEWNLINITSTISTQDLRQLTRGKLLLTVASLSNPEALRLSGNVIAKVSCELFQASISSSNATSNPHGVSGLAWLYLNNEGTLQYNIQLDNYQSLQSPYTVTLNHIMPKRRSTELEDLTPNEISGWINGTLEKLSPKLLEPLYNGKLAVDVAIPGGSVIQGRLVSKPVDDARDAPAPLLLKRENYALPSSATGFAWISIDRECHMHYDVTLNGIDNLSEQKFDLSLEMLPTLAPGAPVLPKYLDTFQGSQVDGAPLETLSNEETARLTNGVCILKVKNFTTKAVLLSTTLKHVQVPEECRSPNTDNDIPFNFYGEPSGMESQPGTCYHEGKFYDEEKQWTSSQNACTMCYCQNGRAKCDTMTCPEIKCNGKLVKEEGECCPICSDVLDSVNNKITKCSLNGKTYSPGAKFHPFLMPGGFETCTVCECLADVFEIKCVNVPGCCKNCQVININEQNDEFPLLRVPKIEGPDPQKILDEGGCKNTYHPNEPHRNNSTYHPYIDTLGEYKCVTCTCLNGNQKCKRETCNLETCNRRREKKRNHESLGQSEFCCSPKECRRIRHKKNRRN
ncbi:dorsal-ventral patterning protein Sog isoform X3 [Aethina tumida]|nr:dorsal-ventral patterning protein Sog isoform X3 [Aethina tumida]